MTINALRGRFAAAEAARHIVDAHFHGSPRGMRDLRAQAIDMLAAALDFEDTPAVELIDEAVRFEIANRASNNDKLMRRRLASYDEAIEDVGEFTIDDESLI